MNRNVVLENSEHFFCVAMSGSGLSFVHGGSFFLFLMNKFLFTSLANIQHQLEVKHTTFSKFKDRLLLESLCLYFSWDRECCFSEETGLHCSPF